MKNALQLKKASISASIPTRYRRTSDALTASYAVTGFEFKQDANSDPLESLLTSYAATGFEKKQAVPPNSSDNLGVAYTPMEFIPKRHPSATVDESLACGYGGIDMLLKRHPGYDHNEPMTVGFSCNLFEYPGVPAGIVPWDPLAFTETPLILLDDKSAVTNVGGDASQWNSRCASAWHAVQATAGNRPTIVTGDAIGRRLMRFNGDMMTLPGAVDLLKGQSSGWMFVAIKKAALDASPNSRVVFAFTTDDSTTSRFVLWNSYSSVTPNDALAVYSRRADGDSSSLVQSTGSVPADWVLAMVTVDYAYRECNLYINGELDAAGSGLFSSAGISSATASAQVAIGGLSGSYFWNGDMACILAGRGVPTPSEIERMFGYYAARFNLRRLLSPTHPYKNSEPYASKKLVNLTFEGTNGSTTFTDDGGNSWSPTSCTISTAQSRVGVSSLYCAPNSGSGGLGATYTSNFNLATESFCIKAWIYPQGAFSVNSMANVLGRGGSSSSNRMWRLYRDQANSRMVFEWGDADGTAKTIVSANGSAPLDTWTHVAVSRWKNTLKLFVNGVVVATGTIVGSITNDPSTGYQVRVGYNINIGSGTAWAGYLDALSLTVGDQVHWRDFNVDSGTF